jgi:hypothetical protein
MGDGRIGGRRLRRPYESVAAAAIAYSATILPLAAVLLWTGLLMAAHRFPTEFDWRYMTVSVLLSPKDNPNVRHWAAAGIGLCGLAILIWTFAVGRSGTPPSSARRSRPHGVYWLRWGGACMVGSGVLPFHLLGLAKTHELLTLLAFIGLCLGAVRLAIDWVEQLDARSRRSAVIGTLVASALIAPIVLAGLAQLYVFYVLPQLHWVGLAWRARGVPVYLSFAFWEWVTFVLLTVYLAGLGAVVRAPS